MILHGTHSIAAIRYGTRSIAAVYRGSSLIWSSAPPLPPDATAIASGKLHLPEHNWLASSTAAIKLAGTSYPILSMTPPPASPDTWGLRHLDITLELPVTLIRAIKAAATYAPDAVSGLAVAGIRVATPGHIIHADTWYIIAPYTQSALYTMDSAADVGIPSACEQLDASAGWNPPGYSKTKPNQINLMGNTAFRLPTSFAMSDGYVLNLAGATGFGISQPARYGIHITLD